MKRRVGNAGWEKTKTTRTTAVTMNSHDRHGRGRGRRARAVTRRLVFYTGSGKRVATPRPRPDPSTDRMRLLAAHVRVASGDSLLLVECRRDPHQPDAPVHWRGHELRCHALRLQPYHRTKDTSWCQFAGILTQSDRPDGWPDRYAVAWVNLDDDINDCGEEKRGFVMRWFLSEKGEWDKQVVGLPLKPSLLPLTTRRLDARDVVAFAGHLWWVNVSWGAVTVDPFSDRLELYFVELPRGSVMEPFKDGKGLVFAWKLDRYRRIGVSEGRLRYAEVSHKEPFVLSSFVLEQDSGAGR
uniref:DUF1618 domain-containing protein n=1 Tax=Leersia perrieri TaxID=77586 RepID=A0A0D9WDY4_9ORYZ